MTYGIAATREAIAGALLAAGRRRIDDPGDVHAAFDFDLACQAAHHANYAPGEMYAQVVRVLADSPAAFAEAERDRLLRWRLIGYAIEFLLAKDAR